MRFTKDNLFNIAGEEVTKKDFMEIEGLDEYEADRRLGFMLDNGMIQDIKPKQSAWDKLMKEAMEKMQVEDKVEMIDRDKEDRKQNNRIKEMKTSYVHEEIAITYPNLLKCQEDARLFYNKLGLKDEPEIYESDNNDGYILILRNITDIELQSINKKLKADDVVEGTVGAVTNVIEGVTDTADMLARNVVAPTTKIAATAVGKTGKVVGVTAVKAGASFINSGATAIKEGAAELSNDEEMLRARSEIRELGRNLKSLFGFKKKSSRIL